MIHIPIDKLPSTIAKMLGFHPWANVNKVTITETSIVFTTGDETSVFENGPGKMMVGVDPNVVLEVSGKTGGRR